jgi:hypothetical protein
LWIYAREDSPDGAILAARVRGLDNNQQLLLALSIKFFLQLANLENYFGEFCFGFFLAALVLTGFIRVKILKDLEVSILAPFFMLCQNYTFHA